MTELCALLPPDVWLLQLFTARAAREGGIVRRQVRDVEKIIGRAEFERELRRRGYHAVENAGQFVIFCNNEQVRVLC
ncbi:MAG TPA: N-(5'-phosphoribosyl)anthranilate isomerase [Paracoccaceae bacterium]